MEAEPLQNHLLCHLSFEVLKGVAVTRQSLPLNHLFMPCVSQPGPQAHVFALSQLPVGSKKVDYLAGSKNMNWEYPRAVLGNTAFKFTYGHSLYSIVNINLSLVIWNIFLQGFQSANDLQNLKSGIFSGLNDAFLWSIIFSFSIGWLHVFWLFLLDIILCCHEYGTKWDLNRLSTRLPVRQTPVTSKNSNTGLHTGLDSFSGIMRPGQRISAQCNLEQRWAVCGSANCGWN